MVKKDKIRHYLQLLEVFTVREVKSRYKASILGPLWIILYPLITAFILNIIFGIFIRIETEGIPYFLFLLSGLVFWNFFEQGLSLAKDSLVWNRDLVTKAAFPKNVLPLSYIVSKIPDFFVYFGILLFFYLFNGYQIQLSLFLSVILLIPLLLFSSGLALLISLTHAIFRDFGRIFDFVLMLLFYATPIVYPASFIPEKYKIILLINPLSLLIIYARELLFKNRFRMDLFFAALLISLFIFLIGIFFFKKFEKKIADLI